MVSEILFSDFENEKNYFITELNLGSKVKYSEALRAHYFPLVLK